MYEINAIDLFNVCGGTNIDDIKNEARPYCKNTVAKYDSVDPSTITRADAEKMGEECLAEMNPLTRIAARGRIKAGIDKAFPQ